ncbi:hypothetical protein MTER_25560 [Mycolicibacter terrae]|uniref:Uncharacterized protein n=1 Tax=Mycolicibacter terrae TaxID=1788 RepID=A0AAD1HZ04_9MYCO|nr:hypothetical protein MTER_25560 [Mycolicibacter terrae]
MVTLVFAAAPSTLTDGLDPLEEVEEDTCVLSGVLSVFLSLEHPDRPTIAIAAAAAATVTERFTGTPLLLVLTCLVSCYLLGAGGGWRARLYPAS